MAVVRGRLVLDLARRLSEPAFLSPAASLARATAALSVGVGYLPVTGAAAGLGTTPTGATVTVLAATAALVQPRAGRALDSGRLSIRAGITTGLLLAAVGLGWAVLAVLPGMVGCARRGIHRLRDRRSATATSRLP